MGAYRKFIMALLGTVATMLAAATSDDVLTGGEVAQTVLAGLGLFSVYVLPNAPGYSWAKTWVAGLTAGVGLVAGWLAEGATEITTSMWLNFAIAVGTAVGVFIIPNDPEPVT